MKDSGWNLPPGPKISQKRVINDTTDWEIPDNVSGRRDPSLDLDRAELPLISMLSVNSSTMLRTEPLGKCVQFTYLLTGSMQRQSV